MPLLLQCKSGLGVCWGPTLSECAHALKQYRDTHAGKYPVLNVPIFPTVGLPPVLHGSTTAWSATQVAQMLSRAMRLTGDVPSLDSFPPLLSGKYAEEPDRSYILEFFKLQHGYKAVFGSTNGKPGLIDDADGLITGAGSNELWPQFGSDSMLRADVSPDTLRELIAGDIGGVVIRAPGQHCGSEFKKLRQQWIGLTLKHIRRVNDNADRSGGPGVVLCAMGSSKAGIVRELINSHKVVRHLIVDHHLAAALGAHTAPNGATASARPRHATTQVRAPSKDAPYAPDE